MGSEKDTYDETNTHVVLEAAPPLDNARLKRVLNNRHITLISIGGTIGTGLFLGTGNALKNGGPLGLFMGYSIMATVVFSSTNVTIPLTRQDPAWGFALSFNYAYNWLIILPAELSAAAVLINYWITSVNNAVWITMCIVIVVGINLFGARGYGEAESLFASIKILTITGCIIMGIALDCGAGPENQGYIGFRYWKDPGPFKQYEGLPGTTGRFLGFWATLTQAAFSFIGTEILAIAAAETRNPQRTLKSAINKVWIRICIFYVLGVFVMGLIVPSNNARLGTASDASASPFVIAAETAGVRVLAHIINACILTSAWSAATADLYTASRSVYGIALNGDLPKVFLRTTRRGLPWVAVAVSALFSFLAYMGISSGSGKVFDWFANMTATAGLMSWLAICVTYIRFRAGLDAQGISRDDMPFKSRFSLPGAYYSVVMIIIICFFSGWTVFLPGKFTAADFVTNYLPCVLFPVLFLGKKFLSKTRIVRTMDMDFHTGRELIVSEEASEEEKTVIGKVTNFFV